MSIKAQPLDYLALVALSLMWSSSFLFIKIAVETVTPMSVASGRMLIAAVALYLFMKIRGMSLPRDKRSWIFFFIIGLIGNAIPFFLISWAELTIDSSVASILIASAPLAAFMIGHVVTRDEKLTFVRFLGVITGFLGIIVLIGPESLFDLGVGALSQLAIVLGAICYVSAGFTARHMPDMDPSSRAAGVLIVASVIAVPITLYLDKPWTLSPSTDSLLALAMLGVFPTAIATLILFFLIMRVGATFVSLNNYINPVLGVVWGYFFMAEHPVQQTYIGLALILGGLVVTQLKFNNLGKKLKSADT
ncbi:MAG: EamA family transporter [Sneathiella sp.]|nr:EamA family transporter [Sneathiella sp.]